MSIVRIPKHIAIIPDGNRRWATTKGLGKEEGYAYGLDPGVAVLRLAKEYNIEEITYYGFTVDNCKRPALQQAAFKQACVDAVEKIKKENNVSLLVIGKTDSKNFPTELLPYTERVDIGEPEIKVNFLVNYGWEWDLSGTFEHFEAENVKEAIFSHDISRIDLVIRWGGMRRLSGLLPVQSVYADFFVIDDFWPDFKPDQMKEALQWYDKQDVTLGG